MMAHIQICRGEEGRIKVILPYDPGLIAKIKTITGQRRHQEEKYWSVPHFEDMDERLVSLFTEEQVKIAPSLHPLKARSD